MKSNVDGQCVCLQVPEKKNRIDILEKREARGLADSGDVVAIYVQPCELQQFKYY